MDKGVIIHLDDKLEEILTPAKNLFDQQGINLDYITCQTKEEFNEIVKKYAKNIKALIFDLISEEPHEGELHKQDAEFRENVRTAFAAYNIPIFIYSGYLQALENEFDSCGTVFRFDKDVSIQEVFDKFKMLHESGFVELFCPDGILSSQLHSDLHKAFTKQFASGDEIERIIIQIKADSSYEDSKQRIQKVFTRVAVRTLLSELLSPEVDQNGNIIEETVNTIEHYVRRIGPIKIWTGDIFRKKDSEEFLFILTPRCNVIRTDSLLVCPFIWKDVIKKSDKISKMLQGDPEVSGYNRYLPPSPVFEGGKVALSRYFMIDKAILLAEYELAISLSDELTNEIIGKFGAHFFRTGITPWDTVEVTEQINNG